MKYWYSRFTDRRMGCIVALVLLLACGTREVSVSDAWVREAPPGSKVNAGYLRIHNPTNQALTLQRVESPAFGAIEIHETRQHEGRSSMHRLSDLSIPAGGDLVLQPGGKHLMLFRAVSRPSESQQIPFTLIFNSGTLSFTAAVRSTPPSNQP